jgi:AcrR family transcriptional regulator
MPRPAPDVDAIRARMLDAAEALLGESRGQRLILSDVAARVGLSQSYAHRFFATKADLIAALAARWFDAVEIAAREAADAASSPADALRRHVLAILRVKKAKHDADPVLFRAYLTLASGHRAVVAAHTARLSEILRGTLARQVPPERLDAAVALVEDATAQFRVPALIALYPERASEARALGVLAALQTALDAGLPATVGQPGAMG